MATRSGVTTTPHRGNRQVLWEGLLNGDSGDAQQVGQMSDKSVQVVGTFGTGGSINIEGSNDGTNWEILVDPQGNALTFTSAALEQILENPRYIRPNVTAGDGTTDLDVYLYARA